MAASAAAVERHDMSTVPDLSLRIEASTNVTMPTPEELYALRESETSVLSCWCWRCANRKPDATLHMSRGYTIAPGTAGVYVPEGTAWTPVDEHDGGPP